MTKVRYGVVGAGAIAQRAFMPSVDLTDNSAISAIVSGDRGKAAALADRYGVENVFSYDEYDTMLVSDVVDAVYIALPNSLHTDFALRAARAGMHILVEKPLATTVADCEAMISAANEAGVLLMTAYRLHNDPGTIEVLEQIRKGAIGQARLFISTFSFQSAPDNHRLQAKHWGGPLQDIGVYCLNACRHIFEAEPIEAIAMKGFGNGDQRFTEVEESIAVTLRFPEDRFAQFIASFGAELTDMYRVIGTTGDITVEPGYRYETDTTFRIQQSGKTILSRSSPPNDHFGAQTFYFSDCILKGVGTELDGEEGLADVRALLAIEEAAATGRPQQITTPRRDKHPGPKLVRYIKRR
ncbi:MAG: Gfo/Idh/MocA family protein [Hyphomicrobiaceae bacterium]